MRGQLTVEGDDYKATVDVTADDVEREFDLSERHFESARERGITELRMVYRAGGWGRLALQKEVGPPPWRLPHVYANVSLRGNLCVRLGVGWRSTLYTATYMAKPHRRGAR